MFSSNVVYKEFALRSLMASPLVKPVLESFRQFEVRAHVKNRFFFLNLSPLYTYVSRKVKSFKFFPHVRLISVHEPYRVPYS